MAGRLIIRINNGITYSRRKDSSDAKTGEILTPADKRR